MFSWAASTFESIVQTVAPPPNDLNYKFVSFCQQANEHGAIECLRNPQSMSVDGDIVIKIDPVRTVIVQGQGQTAFHLTCFHALQQVFDYIVQNNDLGANAWQVLDADGNTPFHCACMSKSQNALDFVKMMLLFGTTAPPGTGSTLNISLVMAKNSRGETPYDVAALNSIRQYILPIQLQAETQAALDNGGIGLPPGVDLGGAKVSYANLPPPPSTTMVQGSESMPGVVPFGNTRYAPPPMPVMGDVGQSAGIGQQQQLQPISYQTTNAYPPPSAITPVQQQFTPAPLANNFPPAMPIPSAQSNPKISESNPSVPTPTTAPDSGGYSLVGRSSAAIYKGSGGRVLPNDGFHSSSSDKSLQLKYGHSSLKPAMSLPPPPSSGNAPNSGGYTTMPGESQSAPASVNGQSRHNNPFAAGGAAIGNRRVGAVSRYPGYDPIRGSMPPPPPPPGSGALGLFNPPMAASPNFSMFSPSGGSIGSSSTSAGLAAIPSAPNNSVAPIALPQSSTATLFSIPPLPPPPSIGSRTAMYNRQGSSGESPMKSSPNPNLVTQPTPANTPIDKPNMLNMIQHAQNPSTMAATSLSSTSAATTNGISANIFSSPPGSTPQKVPDVHLTIPSSTPTSFTLPPSPFTNPPLQQKIISSTDRFPILQTTTSTTAIPPTVSAVSLFSTPSKSDAVSAFVSSSTCPSVALPPSREQIVSAAIPSQSLAPLIDQSQSLTHDDPSVHTVIPNDEDDEGLMDDIPLTPWTDQQKTKVEPFSATAICEQQQSDANVFGSPPTH